MTIRLRRLAAVAALAVLGFAPSARAADAPTYTIAANINDPGIDTSRAGEPGLARPRGPPRRQAARVPAERGRDQPPDNWQEMGAEGGRLGYHTVVLAYRTRFRSPRRRRRAAGTTWTRRVAARAAELHDQHPDGTARRAWRVAAGRRQPGQQHRQPADEVHPAHGGDLPARRVGEVPRHQRRRAGADVVGDRDRGHRSAPARPC